MSQWFFRHLLLLMSVIYKELLCCIAFKVQRRFKGLLTKIWRFTGNLCCSTPTYHETWNLNSPSKMPFSVISKARKPVPQNRPTPMHITVVAISDAYGVLPRQSSQSHITTTIHSESQTLYMDNFQLLLNWPIFPGKASCRAFSNAKFSEQI